MDNSGEHGTDQDSRDVGAPEGMALFGIRWSPSFFFWFTATMAIVGTVAIIMRTSEARAEGTAPLNVYEGIYLAARDTVTYMPIVSLGVALIVHLRRNWRMVAQYFEERMLKNRAKLRAEGEAVGKVIGKEEGRAEGRAWNERRLAAEARGEQFDEPFPGDEAEANRD